MGNQVLVDSNVLLDILEDDPVWFDWSSMQISRCAEDSILVIYLWGPWRSYFVGFSWKT